MKVKYFAWVRERIGKGGGNGRAAGERSHRRRADGLAGAARRDLCPRFREAAGDPRRDRPRPCEARRRDRRRPRNCLFPADDRRLSVDCHDRDGDHPHPASRFRHRAGDCGADERAHRYRRRRQFHRHLPRQRGRRDHRGADARTLSRHGGSRNRAPCRERDVALAADGADASFIASAASRPAKTSCWC